MKSILSVIILWQFFLSSTTTAFVRDSIIVSDRAKKFIARKISKIQADHDNLIELHKKFQNDSIEYSDRSILTGLYNNLGNNCFEFNTTDKYQTYDIITEKIVVDVESAKKFQIYQSAMSEYGKRYFIAIDDSGWVFLLHNFWQDEFTRFIKKKIGAIDNFNKAYDLIKIYIHTKLFDPYEDKKVIITSKNINGYKLKYPYLEPVRMEKFSINEFGISLYTISPYSSQIIYYKFIITRDGKVTYSETIKNESVITD